MANKIFRKDQAVILAKLETTMGVDAAANAADYLAVNNLTVKREKKLVDAPLVKGIRGGDPKVFLWESGTIEFECALAVGGSNGVAAAGVLPQIDVPLRACALQRTQMLYNLTDYYQSGTRVGLALAADASAVDDFYSGHSVALQYLTNTLRAPVSAGLNKVRLANSYELTGTTGTSTATEIKLAGGAIFDGDYVGQTLQVDTQTAVIAAYDGETQTATVGSPLTGVTTTKAFKVFLSTEALAGYQLTVKHYSGTIVDKAGFDSTVSTIFLPKAVVGSTQSLAGMYLKVKTGSNNPDVLRIGSYDKSVNKCNLSGSLSVNPVNTSTFEVLEKRVIVAFDPDTSELTTALALAKATVGGETYSIDEVRLGIGYDGTTKFLSVDKPFSKSPITGGAYTLGGYVEYSALRNSTGEMACSIYYYEEDTLYRFIGCMGTLSIDRNSGEMEKIKFTLTGVVGLCEDSAKPAISLLRFVQALPVNAANAVAVGLHNKLDVVISKHTVDLGNTVIYRNAPNDESIYIMGRNTQLKFTMDKTELAAFDVHQRIANGDVAPFWFANGVLGRQVVLYLPRTQLTGVSDSDSDNIRTHDVEAAVLPVLEGGIDFKLVFN